MGWIDLDVDLGWGLRRPMHEREDVTLTVVRRVISLRSLSRKIGRQTDNSFCRVSPRWARIWPMQAIARSLTSWSMSAVRSRDRVDQYNSPDNGVKSKLDGLSASARISLLLDLTWVDKGLDKDLYWLVGQLSLLMKIL
jgi:hypothetical protein